MEDLRAVARPVDRRNPGDVAVDDEDRVGVVEERVLPLLVPLARQIERVVVREVHRARHGFEHADAKPLAEAHQLADRGRIASEIGRHDQGVPSRGECCDDRRGRIGRKRRRRDRPPVPHIYGNRRGELLLENLAGSHQVGGALRVAIGDLQRAVHDLLDIPTGADLVVVFHVAAHDTALVGNILKPLDELVAAAAKLALLREGRGAGENEDGHAALGGVMDGAADRLRAAFDVDEHGLRLAAHQREAVGAAHRHHLVRAGNETRNRAAGNFRFGHRFDQRRVVAAEIGEDVRDAGFRQRLKECRAGRVHRNLEPERSSRAALRCGEGAPGAPPSSPRQSHRACRRGRRRGLRAPGASPCRRG